MSFNAALGFLSAPRALAAVVLACLSASPLPAELSERSLDPVAQDSLITYDSSTGLEWLDLTLTNGWSVTQALQSTYVTDSGFRVATGEEVDGLFEETGTPPETIDPALSGLQVHNYSNFSLPGASDDPMQTFNQMTDFFGYTSRSAGSGSSSSSVGGLFLSGPAVTTIGRASCYAYLGGGLDLWATSFEADWTTDGLEQGSLDHGVFLVREPGRCIITASHLGRFNSYGLNAVDAEPAANFVGEVGAGDPLTPGIESRGFLAFPVSGGPGTVETALLRLSIGSYTSQHQQRNPDNPADCALVARESEPFNVTAISTPLADLLVDYPTNADGLPSGNLAGQAVFTDLGKAHSESSHAPFSVTAADVGNMIEIFLGAQAVTSINAAIEAGEEFVVGLDYAGSSKGPFLGCPTEINGMELVQDPAAHELILYKTQAAEPFCNLVLSQRAYQAGQVVGFSNLEIGATGGEGLRVDLRIWLERPDGTKIPLISLSDLALVGGASADWGPVPVLPLDRESMRGSYLAGCRMLCPVNGAVLAEDTVPFEVTR